MKQILVVDDEPAIRDVVGAILRDEGFEVLLAADGQHMLSLLQRQQPALILLDVMMPSGGGPAAFESMRSSPHLQDIPVVMMSAGAKVEQISGPIRAFLRKPFELDHLLDLVTSIIGPPHASPEE